MALIEVYHVVPDGIYKVDPASNPNIIEGMLVRLSGNYIVKATGGSGTNALGVAGDSSEDSGGHTEFSADLVINSDGKTRSTAPRVSDAFDETGGSGRITVYASGGKFETDQYETTASGSPITYTNGEKLYSSANAKFTNVASANSQVVGYLTASPRDYPSGVPGTDIDGSMTLGTYMQFKLAL